MADPHDHRLSSYRAKSPATNRWRRAGAFGARWRMPVPPGPPSRGSRPDKAEREAEARTEARTERMHLVGITDAWLVIMGVVLAAVVIMLVLALASRH